MAGFIVAAIAAALAAFLVGYIWGCFGSRDLGDQRRGSDQWPVD